MSSFYQDKEFTVKNSVFAEKILQTVFPNSAVFNVEKYNNDNSTPPIISALDKVGVDFAISTNGKLVGVSDRVYRDVPNRGYTVTMRKSRRDKPAEYDFIRQALRDGGLTARYNLQTYVFNALVPYERTVASILFRNKDLIEYIEKYGAVEYTGNDGTEFYSVTWRELALGGIPIRIFRVDGYIKEVADVTEDFYKTTAEKEFVVTELEQAEFFGIKEKIPA